VTRQPKVLLQPFDPAAPGDTIDGYLASQRAHDAAKWGIPLTPLAEEDAAWLRFYRSTALPLLRRRWPTGLERTKGMSVREACVRAITDRDGIDERGCVACCICHAPCIPVAADVDHVIPLARGGRHHIDNLGLAHPVCNQFKRSRPRVEPTEARAALLRHLERRGHGTGPFAQMVRDFDTRAGRA
jgi:hypothetical protein